MPADVTFYTWFMPIFGFLFVFIIIYALLAKSKILGENWGINIFISFVIAIIFATVSSVRQYVQTVTPWFAVLVIAVFFILLIVSFTQKEWDKFMKPWTWVAVIILIIIFLLSAIKVFGSAVTQYLPGYPPNSKLKTFLFSDQFLGAFLLLVIAAVVSWVLVKTTK